MKQLTSSNYLQDEVSLDLLAYSIEPNFLNTLVMPYRFATENQDYADYSSGRVFYSAPGHPAFPIRLISEVFQRCRAVQQEIEQTGRVTIYDPCCGSAYHLTALAYLHWAEIDTIIGSDIDQTILQVAERNLNLLTQAGLSQRQQEIEKMHVEFGKNSHFEALRSAKRLTRVAERNRSIHPINTHLFQADGLNQEEVARNINGQSIDIVLADIPYGDMSYWETNQQIDDPLTGLLDALLTVVSAHSIVAIMTNKRQKCNHPRYNRVDRFQIGKRRIFLLRPIF